MNLLMCFIIAGSSILVGFAFMGVAYDKPQWYFEVLGIVGLAIAIGGVGFVLAWSRLKSGTKGRK